LNGVVHAAGISGGGVIAMQDTERVEAVFAAKVHGTRILYESFRGEALDWMVLCSSLTSVVPRIGRAEYTAANLFLDAFAHSVADVHVVAINWDNWTQTGMARAAAAGAAVDGLSNDEGINAFACALRQDSPQLIVSTRDLRARPERPLGAPVTSVGAAVERVAPDAPQLRPDAPTPRDPPRNAIEATLVSIWKDLLGLPDVGIHDNFFELGGDSVVSIQLTGRARKAGLNITAKQVFEKATIAELAEAVAAPGREAAQTVAAARGPSHELPLSPVQHWFFELPIEGRNHWNLAVMLETPAGAELSGLRGIVADVLRRHDAFTSRFHRSHGWSHTMVDAWQPPVELVDLASFPDEQIEAALQRVEASMQMSLDITHGPTVRAACVDLGRGRPGRLLVVAHHLAADIISLRLLSEELNEAYGRLRTGGRAQPASVDSMSLRGWLERLETFARSEALSAQLPYWTEQATLAPAALPRDDAQASNDVESSETVEVALDEPTTKLLTASDGTGGSPILGALLGTLAWAVSEWSGAPHAWIDVEGHGRDAFADDIDVARTVGWFTTLHPVALARGVDLHDAVALAQRRIREMPARGFGYGVLRFLHADPSVRAQLARTPRPEIVFLYQGHLARESARAEDLRLIRIGGDACRSPSEPRTHVLEINARIERGVLRVDWVYSRNVHRRQTVERLAAQFAQGLRAWANARASSTSTSVAAGARDGEPGAALSRTARLSFAQERIWFLQQLAPASTLFNKQAVLKIVGELDVEALTAALGALAARHETLRTRIAVSDGLPMQVIDAARPVALPATTLDNAAADRHAGLAATWLSMVREPFDLEAGSPVRVRLVRTARDEHWLGVTFHHIVTDAWSAQVFVRELGALYSAQRRGRRAALAPLPIAFADFAERQRASYTADALAPDLAFWTHALAGLQPLDLPTDWPRPPVQRFDGRRAELRWPAALTTALRALARSSGASFFMVLLALFKVLLHRYALQDDVAVGVPAADRDVDTEDLIGPLVNNLVMRTDLSGNPSFVQLLARLRETVLAANEHRALPFEKLVEALRPERDRSRTPIFQVMFAFMNVPAALETWDGVDVTLLEPDHGAAEFDLSLYCYDARADGELHGWIEYSSALFDPGTIERMAGHLHRLALDVAAAPERPIDDIALLTDEERRHMLVDWNATAVEYPRDKGVHELFEQQVDRQSTRLAARFDDGVTLTYGELDRRANQLARHLRMLGVGRDARVALCTDRSSAMLVGMLGILKAGGAYVPLDPTYPGERLAYMLADCGARVLVTQDAFRSLGARSPVTCVCLDADWDKIAVASDARVEQATDPAGLAYVIYTSGSTGKPKGVQIEHRAVVNFLNAMRTRPGMEADDRLLAVTTMSFDIHVLEIFLPLSVGGTVFVASRETVADATALIAHLAAHEITVMQATPSAWRMLLEAGWTGQPTLKVLCGGEALPPEVARGLLERCASLWNMYGPTEATVWACVEHIVDAEAAITIGRPFDNVRCYVLDPRGLPVPVGIPGELCIGGDCLARGYLDRPELTQERFPPDPFIPGERIYRTGDSARFLPDGRIVVLGRMDGQVKLRGHRIELGEIESVAGAHGAIAQCVAVLREDQPGDQRLVVYAVPATAERPDHRALRDFAAARLPDYMLPSALVWVDKLPLTPNGKIDRRALPAPAPVEPAQAPAAELQTRAERLFGGIFGDVLGVSGVGRYDNFFDLGGHSLLAMRVVDRFHKASGIRMQPGELFQQTVGQLAAHYEPLMAPADAPPASTSSPRFGGAVKSLLRKVVGK